VVVIGLGQFFDLYEIFLAGVLSSVLASQFKLEKGVVALLLASAFIGMFVGAIALGRLADRLGRRRAFLRCATAGRSASSWCRRSASAPR